MIARPWIAGMTLSVALGGCQTVDADTGGTAYYVGLVRVQSATSPDTARRVRTLGVWMDDAVGVGWRDSYRVTVPKGCQVVFLVESEAQLAKARAWVKSEEDEGGKLCVALKDGSP